MVRADLVTLLGAQHPDLPTREIEAIVSAFFDTITARLVDGGRVEIRGFGCFSTRDRVARAARNPRTGERIEVDAKRLPHFVPGKDLRKRVADFVAVID
ncbi:HU family DNA-binding protein [Sphingomonas sp. PAMC 26621]|uniref:HU family DNA-binding protein n=1 Tax=Sphingomonas sp. PAMC 26621 TaxID=1112213 RepID=UPI000288BC64|nr:HU family DNA-binding protein [Sphingomonas sp. PAMC 26621]